MTPSWKTKLNRSISTVEDGISRWLQHCYKTCCKKDGYCERQACIIWRWYHHRNVISRQVNLDITSLLHLTSFYILISHTSTTLVIIIALTINTTTTLHHELMWLNQFWAFSSTTIGVACSTVGLTPSTAGENGERRSSSGNEHWSNKAISIWWNCIKGFRICDSI